MAAPAARARASGEGGGMRQDSHPIAFAAGEAIADHASVALLVWETASGFKYRVMPHASLAVLIGLHDVLGHMIDAMQQPAGDDDDEAE
jgi:hypothetical protein